MDTKGTGLLLENLRTDPQETKRSFYSVLPHSPINITLSSSAEKITHFYFLLCEETESCQSTSFCGLLLPASEIHLWIERSGKMQIKIDSSPLETMKVDALLLVLTADRFPSELASLDQAMGSRLSQFWDTTREYSKDLIIISPCQNTQAEKIILAKISKNTDRFSLRQIFSSLGKTFRVKELAGSLALLLPGIYPAKEEVRFALEGFLQGHYLFESYKKERRTACETLVVWGDVPELEKEASRAEKIASAQNVARDWVNQPACIVTPSYLVEEGKLIASRAGAEVEVLTAKKAESLGMGAFSALARGSEEPAFVLRLHRPGNPTGKRLCFVGKGLTFDSGGLSLKHWEQMVSMKSDMAGAGAVLNAFSVLSELRPDLDLTAITPLTENLPSGRSFKPGDVLKAMNGKTIEVLSTDAEGRLALADAVCWAEKTGATHIVDVATLTGACIIALGYDTSALYANQRGWAGEISAAAERAGERVWEMPLFPEYRELIRSQIADLANSAGKAGAPAGSIAGAMFISEFVSEKTAWAHLDIAGPAWQPKETPALGFGATGVLVRTLVEIGLAF